MKHLKVAILALLLVASFSNVNAQDENNPWAVGFGINAVDFFPTNSIKGTTWWDQYFNANDHYNIVPAISRLTVGRYISHGFSVELDGSFNQISKIGDESVNDLAFWGIDGVAKWSLGDILNWKVVEPYAVVGFGYTWLGDETTWAVNGGAGLNFWFNDRIGINVESKVRETMDDGQIYSHFQHSAGIIFKMGGKDTDGDGVYDKNDACPEVFGLAEFNGCPDTDGDGIIDSEDACPDVAGLAEFKGCPDTDGDGIADKDDACPTVAGLAALQGCPDADGDGVADKDDACPTVAGPVENKGCPWADTDGDGVADKDDACPNEAGPASNKGCPEGLSDADLAKIAELTKGVYFKSESAEFTEEMPSRLDMIAEILNANPNEEYVVEGYCDSTGSEAYNNKLSEARANTVRDYLISKDVNADSLSTKGYGKSNPVQDNSTSKGRAANRRIEIKLAE